MSNFPLSYKLSWLPRFLRPSLAGDRRCFAAARAAWIDPPPRRTVRLVFIGDISAVANRDTPSVDPALRALLGSADLIVGNCESPVVERPASRLGTMLGIRHAMTAGFLRDALEAAGIGRKRLVLSVANNHALDQGVDGFAQTLAALRALGVRAIGLAAEPVARIVLGGPSPDDTAGRHGLDPSVQRGGEWSHAWPGGNGAGPGTDGAAGDPPLPLPGKAEAESVLTLGLAAFTLWRNTEARGFEGRVATDGSAAAWPRDAVRGCDLLCAVPHWDREFRHFPQAATRALARRLADAGAGLVVGGHAHVVQPAERIGGTLVAYGLGDFLGTAFARQPWPCRIGAMLAVEVGLDARTRGRIAGYRLHPFFRLPEGRHERLVPVEALDAARRGAVERRLAAVLGPA